MNRKVKLLVKQALLFSITINLKKYTTCIMVEAHFEVWSLAAG